ncbi:MAG: MFS transporter [Cytophagaceae bacterium]
MLEKNNKKVINAWCMYDWANSVYSLTIISAIFPIYFSTVAKGPDGSDVITFLGISKQNSVIYTYSISAAFLAIAFLSPLLSGIADFSGRKKTFMRFFVYLGACSCMMLYFFDGTTITLGIISFMLATIGFAGSLVFYNAYLPEIATPDRHDQISAKGFAYGYIGSILLLIINIAMIQMPEFFGMQKGTTLPARLSFFSVGVWWLAFAHYSLHYLPSGKKATEKSLKYLTHGFRELKNVFSALRKMPLLMVFLVAFFFYSMGFQTIMYLASIFGANELKIPETGLIITILLIQIIAIAGAYLFAFLSSRIGNIRTLSIALIICIFICVGAWLTHTAAQFYALAVVVGLIMGGLQSLSRSTYSKLLPETKDTASYFSFYEFTEKIGIVLGTGIYALITDLTGSMRNSIIALLVFFLIGLILLLRLKALNGRIVEPVMGVDEVIN